MRRIPNLIVIFAVLMQTAFAITTINITKGNVDPIAVAIYPFSGESDKETEGIIKEIIRIISTDLESSGLFKSIDKGAFIEKIVNANQVPNFASWRQINSTGLVTGRIHKNQEGKYEIEFRLWDNFAEQQIAGKIYTSPFERLRQVAHKISDDIYSRMTGEKGYFDSKIAYVAESGDPTNPIKRIALMDQDGSNHEFLTDGRHMALTPRFSPATNKVMYMSYNGNKPRVYMIDLLSRKEYVVGDFEGMSFAPVFSPDGKQALMSVSSGGNSDIYVLDLKTKRKTKITSDKSINTSPSYSPDGKKIVFNSDRSGRGQLYIMNPDGSDQRRISFGEGSYSDPVWSPRGDLIAFTKRYAGEFYIGVMRPDGKGERILTRSYMVEAPSWAPNGRVLIYRKNEPMLIGKKTYSKLYSIDLTGFNEREVKTPLSGSYPSWSNLLQ